MEYGKNQRFQFNVFHILAKEKKNCQIGFHDLWPMVYSKIKCDLSKKSTNECAFK